MQDPAVALSTSCFAARLVIHNVSRDYGLYPTIPNSGESNFLLTLLFVGALHGAVRYERALDRENYLDRSGRKQTTISVLPLGPFSSVRMENIASLYSRGAQFQQHWTMDSRGFLRGCKRPNICRRI